eukprot:TRINITY_DN17108_c0_g1_i1.p1 TRINITY_DN17108_c0_g1~~TRINITY_DN17108_c0_g1_i1.p1  ORF type:complete len:58 (-),score=3.91 TRINITY_DN17108_c0_g1_i1:134-307(-)
MSANLYKCVSMLFSSDHRHQHVECITLIHTLEFKIKIAPTFVLVVSVWDVFELLKSV